MKCSVGTCKVMDAGTLLLPHFMGSELVETEREKDLGVPVENSM